MVERHVCEGNILLQNGAVPTPFAEALAQYRQAMEIQPGDPMVQRSLAWLRATWPSATGQEWSFLPCSRFMFEGVT